MGLDKIIDIVRFLHPQLDTSDVDHDVFTDRVISEIVAKGEAFFGGTTWNGKRCMRVSVCNWQTNEGDLSRERSIRSRKFLVR